MNEQIDTHAIYPTPRSVYKPARAWVGVALFLIGGLIMFACMLVLVWP